MGGWGGEALATRGVSEYQPTPFPEFDLATVLRRAQSHARLRALDLCIVYLSDCNNVAKQGVFQYLMSTLRE